MKIASKTTIVEDESFPNFDFSLLSEADIRGEVIEPTLRRLGYRSGTLNTVVREKTIELRYPHMFLGRKKPGKDPILRGRPDFICEARNITRWVIEAKSPNDPIQRNDIEQAQSYAFHSELAAPLFVLCNGREWQVFETNRGPAAEPLLRLTHEQLRTEFHKLHNLLSPEGLNRRFPIQAVDHGRPLASRFGSRASIVGGFTRYDQIDCLTEGHPGVATTQAVQHAQKLVGYQTAITGEACYRDDSFGIVADVTMHFPHESMGEFARAIGIDRNRYVTREPTVSESADKPTIFEFTQQCTLPPGKPFFDITQFTLVTLPRPIRVTWYAEAIGHIDQNTFLGTYASRMLAEPLVGPMPIRQWTYMRGTFAVELRAA